MANGSLQGRARTSLRNPQAKGLCDSCGFWYQLSDLRQQMQWRGTSLAWTGEMVCPRCYDTPQEQLRSIILPPDPYPRANPRPDPAVTPMQIAPAPPLFADNPQPPTPGNQGFTQYLLGSISAGTYPTAKADVLAAIATATGIDVPGGVVDNSTTIATSNTAFTLIAAAARSWIAIYNPAVPQFAFNLSTAVWGLTTNLMVGPGECWFWATEQGNSQPWQGAITAIGLTAGMPVYCWQAA